MQINLLSLFLGGAQAPTQDIKAAFAPQNAQEADLAYQNFDALYSSAVADLTPQQLQETPTPKLMAAFLQRLTTINTDAVQGDAVTTENSELFSAQQILTNADDLGIDSEQLEAFDIMHLPQGGCYETKSFCGEILAEYELQTIPTSDVGVVNSVDGRAATNESLNTLSVETFEKSDLGAALKVLVELSQTATEQNLTLDIIDSASNAPLVEYNGEQLSIPDEVLASLSNLFDVPLEVLRENMQAYQLVSIDNLEYQAKAPGVIELMASVLNMPADQVWEKLDNIADLQLDMPLEAVMAALVQPENPLLKGALGLTNAQAGKQNTSNNANLQQLNGMATSRRKASGIEQPKLNNLAPALPDNMAKFLPQRVQSNIPLAHGNEKPIPAFLNSGVTPPVAAVVNREVGIKSLKQDQKFELPKASATARFDARSQRNQAADNSVSFSARAALARQDTLRSAAPLKQDNMAPLLRESMERPLAKQASFEASSSLGLSAGDNQRLDFDSKLRETRIQNRNHSHFGNVREQVVVQVKQGITRGDSNINIRLNPSELGRVDVRIEVHHDGRTTLAIVAENRDTLEMLQRDSRNLEKAFADLGMQMSDSGMSFNLSEQGFQNQQQEEGNKEPLIAQKSAFESALAGSDDYMAEALLDGSPVNYLVGADDSLNIKV